MLEASGIRYALAGKRVWVAGHRGMVGAALVRRLARENCEILTVDRQDRRPHATSRPSSDGWRTARPQAVFVAAAKVGGILANDSYPAEFLYENLMIEANVIHAAWKAGVEKLLFLGSSCIYPKHAPQPIPEEALLTGPLEPTNEWYAIAKIAGIKLAQAYRRQYGCDFISAMPTNLYGPGDNYDLKTSHVLPALIRKAHEAKVRGDQEIVDLGHRHAAARVPARRRLRRRARASHEGLFRDAAHQRRLRRGLDRSSSLRVSFAEVVGFKGEIARDLSKPDGTPRKLMSNARLTDLGWRPAIDLRQGIASTYSTYLADNRLS